MTAENRQKRVVAGILLGSLMLAGCSEQAPAPVVYAGQQNQSVYQPLPQPQQGYPAQPVQQQPQGYWTQVQPVQQAPQVPQQRGMLPVFGDGDRTDARTYEQEYRPAPLPQAPVQQAQPQIYPAPGQVVQQPLTQNPLPPIVYNGTQPGGGQIQQIPQFQPVAPAPVFDPDGPVTIALLAPKSDRRKAVRALAESLENAARLAAADLGDERLSLKIYDTAGDPQTAAAATQKALSEGAQLILGPLFSGSVAASKSVAAASGVNMIAFSTDRAVMGGNAWSIGFLPEQEIRRIVSFAAKRGLTQLGAFSPNSPYGAVVFDTMQGAAQQAGAQVLRVQPYTSDFQAVEETVGAFAEFYQKNPMDAVLIASGGQTLQAISAYLAYNDVLPKDVKYLGPGSWEDEATLKEATLKGGWFAAPDPVLRDQFEKRYSAAYGSEPEGIARLAYDGFAVAVALLADGRAAGDMTPFDAQAITDPSGFAGVTGVFRFRADGANERGLAVLEVGSREFTVIDPAPQDFSSELSSLSPGF